MPSTPHALASLEDLRRAELDLVKPWLGSSSRILEVGGGSGYQASVLKEWGHDVTSIDLPSAPDLGRFHAVQTYDGRCFPFEQDRFDLVFSSNVLEHVTSLSVVLSEMGRVLSSEGLGIHLVPTASWRLWAIAGHYPWVAQKAWLALRERPRGGQSIVAPSVSRPDAAPLARALIPGSHGGQRNAVAELWTFSRRRWEGVLGNHGVKVVHYAPNRLFYTGYLFGSTAVAPHRRTMSRVLGSACHLFVTRSPARL